MPARLVTEETEGTGTEEHGGNGITRRNGETGTNGVFRFLPRSGAPRGSSNSTLFRQATKNWRDCRAPRSGPDPGTLADVPYNKTTGAISIEAAIEVHRSLGPGLLESSYVICLHYELSQRALRFDSQRAVPVRYQDITLPSAYRIDLIVEDLIAG